MTNRIFKVSMMAAAVGAALSLSAPASAITGAKFAWDGNASSTVAAYKFNWGIEQFMIQGANAAATVADIIASCPGPLACSGEFSASGYFYGQGRLNTIENFPGTEVLNGAMGANSITYQFKIPVSVEYSYTYKPTTGTFSGNQVNGSITNIVATPAQQFGANNYFRIFYNSAGDETNQTAGIGYGTSEEVNASQKLIMEGKVAVAGAGSNNVSTTDPIAPIGTTGSISQGGTAIYSVSGGGSVTLNIEQCDAADVAGPGTGNPEAACSQGTTFVDTNFFRSDLDGLAFDINMLPGYQALFGDTPVPARVVTSQIPNFGFDGTFLVNNPSCDSSGGPTAGVDATGAAFLGCDMIFRGTNSNAQFNGNFAPEPGSLALLGLGLSALGFSARRKSRKAS